MAPCWATVRGRKTEEEEEGKTGGDRKTETPEFLADNEVLECLSNSLNRAPASELQPKRQPKTDSHREEGRGGEVKRSSVTPPRTHSRQRKDGCWSDPILLTSLETRRKARDTKWPNGSGRGGTAQFGVKIRKKESKYYKNTFARVIVRMSKSFPAS